MGEELVEAQVKKVIDSGRIKDDKVALMWVEHFTNRGKSAPFIRMKLREKGVDSQIIDDAITQIHDQMQDLLLLSQLKI